jgi:hypothetical protein
VRGRKDYDYDAFVWLHFCQQVQVYIYSVGICKSSVQAGFNPYLPQFPRANSPPNSAVNHTLITSLPISRDSLPSPTYKTLQSSSTNVSSLAVGADSGARSTHHPSWAMK